MNHLDNYTGPEPSREVLQTLARCGATPQGFPIYRMVWSAYVMEKKGGSWNMWDRGLNVQDRGGIVTGEASTPVESYHRPDRVVVDVIETQRYSQFDTHGWVLERWFPAVLFGSPEAWFQHVVPGTDVPLLGPYPNFGDYIAIYGPAPLEPPVTFLQDFIASWEERRASYPADVELHQKQRYEAAEKREQERSERAQRENTERLLDSVAPIHSTTLEAGRWRTRQFEAAGFTSHIGN